MAGSIKRLYSFGFLFGARDQGAVETTEQLSEGMDSLKESVQEVGASTNRIARFGNALSAITVGQLSRVNDTLSSLASRAGALGHTAEDTQLESFGAQFGQTFRQATAGLGQYRAEVDRLRGQISGTAFNLQVDAGDILGAVTRVARTGRSLADYGLTVRDLGGSIQANILSGEQLGTLLTGLSEGYDLGAEGATNLIDTITALGERAGAGADALRAMPQALEAADDIISSFPAGAAPGIDSVMESITRLAVAGQDRLGGDFNASMQDAIQTFQQLGGQRRELRNLLTGISSDFPSMAQEIGIASGNIDGALQSVMEDPISFATNMQQLMSQLDPTSAEAMRLMSTLEQLPAGFRFLVTGGEESAAALERARQPIDNVSGAFSRMARGASGSTRTFGESMQLLEDAFKTRMNRMTTITNREVLGRQRAAYERMGNYLERWRSDDGPLGLLTQGLLDFRRHGIIGLTATIRERLGPTFPWLADRMETVLPIVGDLGGGLFEMASEMGPLLLVMSQMGGMIPGLSGAVGLLLNPWTLLIGGLAAAIYYWDELGPLIERGAEYLEDFAGIVVDWVDSVDWQAMGDTVATKISELFASFGEGGRAREIMRSLAGAMRQVFSGLGDALSSFSTGLFGESGGGMLNSIFGFLWDSSNIGNLMRAIEEGDWADIIFEGLWTAMSPLHRMLRAGLTELLGFDVVGEFWDSVMKPTFQDLANFWNAEISPLIDEAIIMWQDLAAIAVAFWEEDLQPVLEDLKEEWIETWEKQIKPHAIRTFRAIGEWGQRMWTRYLRPALFAMARAWLQSSGLIRDTAIRAFSIVLQAGIRTFYGIQTAIGRLVIAWQGWRDILRNGWHAIGTTIRNSVGMALEFASYHFNELVEGWQTGMIRIERGFRQLPITIIESIQQLVGDSPVARAFRSMAEAAGISLGAIDDSVNELVSDLREPVSQLDTQLEDMQRAARTRARAHETAMANYQSGIDESVQATRDAYNRWDRVDETFVARQNERMEGRLAGVRRFEQRARDISQRFNQRLQSFVEGVESGRFRDEAERRRQQAAAEAAVQAARPIMADLEQAAAEGRISASQYEQAAATLTTAVRSGESEVQSAAERLRATMLSEEAAPDEPSPRRGGRRRARVRAQAAGGGESPAQRDRDRRQAQREAEQSSQEAQAEMTIAAFGPQAVRQLREAFMGGGASRGGGRRGPRVGGPEGGGDVH